MAAVALHPMPFDAVRSARFDQLLPQLGVLDRLFVGGPPAIALPVVDPPRDAVANVNTVGMELHTAGTLESLESTDCGQQFHAVVGRQRFAAGQLALLVAHAQKRRPTARTGVSAARSVGKDLDQVVQATSSRGSLKIIRSGE